jgi:hypothetical protein
MQEGRLRGSLYVVFDETCLVLDSPIRMVSRMMELDQSAPLWIVQYHVQLCRGQKIHHEKVMERADTLPHDGSKCGSVQER